MRPSVLISFACATRAFLPTHTGASLPIQGLLATVPAFTGALRSQSTECANNIHNSGRLLSRTGLHTGFLSWGSVLWLLPCPGPHIFFEGEDTDPVLMLTATGYARGLLSMIPHESRQMEHWHRDEVFTVIVAIAM